MKILKEILCIPHDVGYEWFMHDIKSKSETPIYSHLAITILYYKLLYFMCI